MNDIRHNTERETTMQVSVSNVHRRYNVGSLAFDNFRGVGAVPYNQEVLYMGFAIMMKPSDFFRCVPWFNGVQERSYEIQKLIDAGNALGTPFLQVTLNYSEYREGKPLVVKIKGHEGRARMWAIQRILGDVEVPVHIFPRAEDGEIRARHLDAAFFEAFRICIKIPERKQYMMELDLTGEIFWNSEAI
jgi:hypothetical protein